MWFFLPFLVLLPFSVSISSGGPKSTCLLAYTRGEKYVSFFRIQQDAVCLDQFSLHLFLRVSCR